MTQVNLEFEMEATPRGSALRGSVRAPDTRIDAKGTIEIVQGNVSVGSKTKKVKALRNAEDHAIRVGVRVRIRFTVRVRVRGIGL